MTDSLPIPAAPEGVNALVSATQAATALATPAPPAHAPDPDNPLGLPDTLDPADYDWHPIARRKRADGWTHTRQRKFIEELADTGSVGHAARAVEMSMQSCYRLRRAPGAEAFAAAWDAAIEEASRRLVDIAMERAVGGVADPVFDKDGACIAVRRRYNDRLLMFLLRAHQPDRYRYAHGDVRHPGEATPAPAPVAHAIARLTPPVPAHPEQLVPSDELETRLLVAEISDGALPHYLRDGPGDCDVTSESLAPDLDKRLSRTLARHADGREPEPLIEDIDSRSHLL